MAVKDYSIRVVGRKYTVTKSNRTVFRLITVMPDHMCIPDDVSLGHRNLDVNMITNLLKDFVRRNPAYELENVERTVKIEFGFDISYSKAWHGLKRAIADVYRTWESSVQELPTYMETLQNVDGTYLYEKYKHVILISATIDANHHVLPLAFAIVDTENTESWLWFLQLVSRYIVQDRYHTCLISDRHVGITSVVKRIHAFHPSRGRHRFCLRHKARASIDQLEFNETMAAIQLLNQAAYDWLNIIDKSKWAIAYDEGWRHGIITTNLLECINGVLKGARRLPITALVQLTYDRMVSFFVKRLHDARDKQESGYEWSPWARTRYIDSEWKSRKNMGVVINEDEYEAKMGVRWGAMFTRFRYMSYVPFEWKAICA
ncbi:uncharacterized protein LOC127242014 [Andrographis paniculata]|uniref:uncharacterized protein LOC127242014 n=1 Tax=Andrographis paniculata TaxID=175694 RepID=UPI0021E7D4BA|nr:uncharacterized protein LOC127242014 [Andrographis paniculata]